MHDVGALSEVENIEAERWRKSHKCKRDSNRLMTITVVQTGIAPRIDVQCMDCGKTKDISDYESW